MNEADNLGSLFEEVCTIEDGDKIRVVTPFAHNDAAGAQRACDAFWQAREQGAAVSLHYWDFDYEGRAPVAADFAPSWRTPRC